MKNIHVLPTDKPSRLIIYSTLLNEFRLLNEPIEDFKHKKHISITSDEEIKEGDWYFNTTLNIIQKSTDKDYLKGFYENYKKIILTTDQELIKDGVQATDDEFLEWFVKNSSCEEVEVTKVADLDLYYKNGIGGQKYKIIIPKEKPKQLFTDYPITELGDEEFKEVPIRQCELLSYDDNKYCYVKVEGIGKEIKRCYIYSQKGRCGEVDCISVDEIKELLKEQPKQDALNHFLSTSNVFVKDSHKWDFSKEEPKKEYQTCKCGSNWFNTTVADKPFCFKCGKSVKEDFKPTEEDCSCTDECLGYLTKTCKGIETLEQIDQNNPVTRGSTALVYKQETLEEAAERLYPAEWDWKEKESFIEGAQWQQEKSYSEEEVIDFIKYTIDNFFNGKLAGLNSNEIFKKFKKNKLWKKK
jgi:hypothetical protein